MVIHEMKLRIDKQIGKREKSNYFSGAKNLLNGF